MRAAIQCIAMHNLLCHAQKSSTNVYSSTDLFRFSEHVINRHQFREWLQGIEKQEENIDQMIKEL